MDNVNNRSTPLIVVMVLFLVLLLLYVYVLLPSNSKLTDQQSLVDEKAKQVQALQKSIESKGEAADLPEKDIQAALPLWDNSEQLVLALRDIGGRTGAQLNSATMSIVDSNQIQTLSGEAESPFPIVKEVSVHVSLQGSYSQLKNWIDQLQKQQRIIVVNTFNLEQAEGGFDSAELAFTAYFDPSYQAMLKNPILPETAK